MGRRSGAGACTRRVHVSKLAADAFVTSTIVEALDGQSLNLSASTRQLDDTRAALAQATAAKNAWLETADVLTKDELETALAPRRAAEKAAQDAYDAALAAAEDRVVLPRSGSAFLALDEQRQRRTARSLIDRIVVSPPVTGGTVEDRFSVLFTKDRWTASGRSAREVGRRRLPGLFDNPPPPPGRGIVTKEPTVPAFS